MIAANLKHLGLQLCTCIWIEIMTCIGITLYLLIQLHSYTLAALTLAVFMPLIVFHFVMTRISKKEEPEERDSARCRLKYKSICNT